MSKATPPRTSQQPDTESTGNQTITTDREDADQGGHLFYRCQTCGRESIRSSTDILHRDTCEVTDRA